MSGGEYQSSIDGPTYTLLERIIGTPTIVYMGRDAAAQVSQETLFSYEWVGDQSPFELTLPHRVAYGLGCLLDTVHLPVMQQVQRESNLRNLIFLNLLANEANALESQGPIDGKVIPFPNLQVPNEAHHVRPPYQNLG